MTQITTKFHPGWMDYFKSEKGVENITSVVNALRLSSIIEQLDPTIGSVGLSYALLKLDPRLQQFIPIGDDPENAFSQNDFVALLDLTGMMRDADLKPDCLFTAIALMAHGVGEVVSYYSSGTDQCDLENTEVMVLKGTYKHPMKLKQAKKVDADAIMYKYNLDPEIFFEHHNTDSGAGCGDMYDNSFTTTLLGDKAGLMESVLLATHEQEPYEEEGTGCT